MKFNSILEAYTFLRGLLAEALVKLFQDKHLYQNVAIDMEGYNKAEMGISPPAQIQVAQQFHDMWHPEQLVTGSGFNFRTPDVKLFCKRCNRVEAFNHIDTNEICGVSAKSSSSRIQATTQTFSSSFLCQSCKIVPEVFLFRREGLKLTLCGRSPMEHVDVPDYIPKSVQSFYSGGIIAHQSGQTLAGNFLLRCLIEQWVISRVAKPVSPEAEPAASSPQPVSAASAAGAAGSSPKNMQADEAIESYMATLPGDFKARFPSIRELYGKLSIDIHTAAGKSDLFQEALNKLQEHFEARRLFKLDSH